jgi:transcriptional regulator with XRE-family HTH domain
MGDMQDIIDRIKSRRLELNLSYQDLSDLTGISKSTLQRYETGYIKNLAIDKLEILAAALRISPGYIMGWEGKKEIQTLAAHHDGEEWTEEELEDIENFKKYVLSKRNKK